MTKPSTRRHRRLVLLTAMASLAALLAACTPGPSPQQGTSSAANEIFQKLPQDIKDKGYITVATDPQFGPPTNYHPANDPNSWAGVEPDLLRALEPVLGVKVKTEQAAFESIITGVRSGRYDLGVNSLSDTRARQQQVDLIDWWTGVNIVIAKKDNPQNIRKLADLCGKPVAIVQGSSDQAFLSNYSEQNCGGAGAIQLQTFANRPACLLALKTDRVVATAGGSGFSINLAYNLDGNQGDAANQYSLLTDVTYAPSPAGIAIAKDHTQLRDALVAGIKKLIDDGTYAKIMDKWHWPKDGLMTAPAVNAATS
jgi:polar amino acid transport system substrate-binding protein